MIAKEKEKQLVLALRKKGHSYSQIRKQVDVSKSTLSLWLGDFPLSKLQIRALRDKNPERIEKYRNTMRLKREAQELEAFINFKKKIKSFSEREKLISGLFLYWGEGTKSAPCTVAVTNTDPDIMKFFVHWLSILGVKKEKLKVVLHLYSDMNINKEMQFWSSHLTIPLSQFRKPYIKKTRLCDITYKSGFGHGTCSVLYLNKELYLFVRSGLKFLRMHA
ncbi:MAG: helix-turn-helix domain-containing protein [Patescibacteria group bacterium]